MDSVLTIVRTQQDNGLLHRLALLCMMALAFFIPTDGVGFVGSLPVVKTAGLISFGLVLLMLVTGTALRGLTGFLMLSMLYIAWAIFSFLWTSMPVDYVSTQAINSQQSLKAHLYLLMIVLLLFQVLRSERDWQWLVLAFLGGSYLLVLLALQGYQPGATTVRYELAGLDANEMSVQLAMGLPLAIYLLSLGHYGWMRLLGALYLPLALLAIIATGSRTGFVVLLIGLLGLLPLLVRSGLLVRLLGVLAVAAALIVTVSIVPDRTFERIFSTGSELSQGTLSERTVTWQKAYWEWDRQPLFGHGLGSFKRLVNKYNVDYTAHNSFVTISVEQGLVGLLFFSGVVGLAFYYALQLGRERRLLLFSLVGVVTAGQLTLTLHENMYIWLAYTLVAVSWLLHQPAAGQGEPG
ncbi:MAG: O-antigen ligase family protein [Thiolinea sp.]